MNNVVNSVAIEEPMEEEWTYDPNEPRYCICNQVSYGDMVACDNQDVSTPAQAEIALVFVRNQPWR